MGIDDISDTRNALIDLNGNGILDPGERLIQARSQHSILPIMQFISLTQKELQINSLTELT